MGSGACGILLHSIWDGYKMTILQTAYTMCRHWTKELFVSWAGQNRKHLTPQSGTQLKMYELFIPGVFHLVFLDHDLLEVT